MKILNNFINKYLTFKSKTLITLLTLYFGFALNIKFWSFMANNLNVNSFDMLAFALSILLFILVPLYVIFNLIVIPYIGKYLVALMLIATSSANFMMVHYGIYIDKHMIQNVIETNARESADLMTLSTIFWIFISGVLPAILIFIAKIKYASFKKEFFMRILKIILALAIFAGSIDFCFKEYASFGRNNKEVQGLINVVNYVSGSISVVKRTYFNNREFKILDTNPQKVELQYQTPTVFVIVVGETSRAANFSLNGYERKTNPLLEKQDIVYYKDTTSCGTATAESVPCLFSNMTKDDFSSSTARSTENVIDLLQKANYDIIWEENDDGCKGVCTRVEKNIDVVDVNNPKYCNGKYCKDGVLIEDLGNILKDIKKDTVIVLHTMGSHGPTYYKRYPDEFKKFVPTCDTADIQNCELNSIINTYDNTILYTDYIVSSAIDELKKHPKFESGLIYFSDHGESLGENNVYLHGMPYAIAPTEQTHVPMLIWMNENMKKFDSIDYNCLKNMAKENQYSHDNIFHSVLGLLEIESSTYERKYDIFSSCRTKTMPFNN
jgi:lipid A ethanolaminephosphotransferase